MFLVCNSLNTNAIESLVIAYKGRENSEELLTSLKQLWTKVEEYVKIGKLSSVGLSDVSTNEFIDLFHWANVRLLQYLSMTIFLHVTFISYSLFIQIKPNIIQIVLATCCVVPAALQEFTKENDVQLLTHSDPGGK